ncbi:DNA methyltransferase [Flavivirga abyssicola]|uniref:DNA methyltransferase n=1 Tax=Flavivirga abyssicola TaxID=3063533 RepID=UPI0026E06B5A|nr:DNA methyltransferase [Flavivirga sp. MEBiC07777]WVK13175.1 DNA methyltransferase [Flavivirga sp. MEBiC07777]
MPVKYIPYTPNTVEGQAVLDNITRTQRLLRYRENNEVYNRIKRGMPYYEVETVEQVGKESENIVLRGECISACAYLKEQNIKVDLVYIDPPFASGADYAKKVHIRKNPKLAEKVAKAEAELEMEELKAFEETMYGDIWKKEDYLNWMYENLQAIKSIMSENASIYVHLDPSIGHYVKILMDEVFGEDNFRNEIIWCYKTSLRSSPKSYGKDHDNIFFYSNSEFSEIHPDKKDFPSSESTIKRWKPYADENGFVSNKHFAGSKSTIIDTTDESKGFNIFNGIPRDWWEISANVSKGNTDEVSAGKYATQKPESLLERIIKASSNKEMVVADFFGGSGVTAKVANELGRKFIHCDVGINSIQTVRDRLIAEKADFKILEVKDGVSLFRNPQQTMDKLGTLITGLQKKVEGVSKFWFGAINDSKLGVIPVYAPDLIDSKQKVLDIPTINRIINQEIQNLNITVKKIIVYYIDIDDEKELLKFIKDNNATTVEIELKDLKNLLHETVVNDEVEFSLNNVDSEYTIEIEKFVSDRLLQKIGAFNEKGNLQSLKNGKKFNPIEISEEGLELIELISLDCNNKEGKWFSSTEIKIDKLGYVITKGEKSKDFWNGKITTTEKPLRIKVRNISGDELIKDVE